MTVHGTQESLNTFSHYYFHYYHTMLIATEGFRFDFADLEFLQLQSEVHDSFEVAPHSIPFPSSLVRRKLST